MGLDQFMYRFKKYNLNLASDEILKSEKYEELSNDDSICIFNKNEYDTRILDHGSNRLKLMMEHIKSEVQYINIKEIFSKSYPNIDFDHLLLCCESYGQEIVFTYCEPDDTSIRYDLTLKDEDVENHLYTEVEDLYIIESDEISYWRKNYILQSYMKNKLKYTGNCCYLEITEDQIKEIISDFKSYIDGIKNEELSSIIELGKSKYSYDVDISYEIQSIISQLESILSDTGFNDEIICYKEWF